MNRAVFTSATVAALIAAAGGGFIAGRARHSPAETSDMAMVTQAAAQTSGAPIYYQDPDGKPLRDLQQTSSPGVVIRPTADGVGRGSRKDGHQGRGRAAVAARTRWS